MRSLVLHRVFVLGIAALAAMGCASDKSQLAENVAAVDNWIDNPGDIKETLATVGSAKLVGNESSAKSRAEADGRAKMAQTARAQVQSLMSNWFKEAGDNLDQKTLSSYMNDEGLIRQVTDIDIIGARPVKYAQREGYQYVLMVIEDPETWTKHVGSSVKDQLLKDQTLFKTEVFKQDFEKKLDALIERDAQAAANQFQQVTGT